MVLRGDLYYPYIYIYIVLYIYNITIHNILLVNSIKLLTIYWLYLNERISPRSRPSLVWLGRLCGLIRSFKWLTTRYFILHWTKKFCRCGEIGIHARFRFWSEVPVGVQIPSSTKTLERIYSSVVEHWTFNPLALGSIPNMFIITKFILCFFGLLGGSVYTYFIFCYYLFCKLSLTELITFKTAFLAQ